MACSGLVETCPDTEHFAFLSAAETFSTVFFNLLQTLERNGLEAPRAVHYLEDLLLRLHEQAAPASGLSPLEIGVRDWLEEIRCAPQKPWNVSMQARRFSVSEAHLRRVVKKLVGVPPHRFIVERRLDAVAARLRASNESLKSLASAGGFEDLPHFHRVFTRRYGLPPAAYRKQTQLLK
jgi:AraC-like DNA-binding protein